MEKEVIGSFSRYCALFVFVFLCLSKHKYWSLNYYFQKCFSSFFSMMLELDFSFVFVRNDNRVSGDFLSNFNCCYATRTFSSKISTSSWLNILGFCFKMLRFATGFSIITITNLNVVSIITKNRIRILNFTLHFLYSRTISHFCICFISFLFFTFVFSFWPKSLALSLAIFHSDILV